MATDVPDWAKDTSSSVPDWAKESTSPKESIAQSQKRTAKEFPLSERAGAIAYGAGTGAIGAAGELEKMLASTIPKAVGLQNKNDKESLFGRETLFPTVSEAQQLASKIGIEKPRKELEFQQNIGEMIGGFGAEIPRMLKGSVRAFLGTPSQTSEEIARRAETMGFSPVAAQVKADSPIASKGALGATKDNQRTANTWASLSTGEVAPGRNAEINRDFLNNRINNLGKQFDEVYQGKTFNIDPEAVDVIRGMAQNEQLLPNVASNSQVKNTAQNIVNSFDRLANRANAIPNTFGIEGDALQRIRNSLTQYARSTNPQNAREIYGLVDALDASVARNHPDVAATLEQIRPFYRNTMALEELMGREGIRQGNISLEQLGNMLGSRKGQMRRDGDGQAALLDQLAEIGSELKFKARWQTSNGETGVAEDTLGKILRTGGDLASNLTGRRSKTARALQKSLGQENLDERALGFGFQSLPEVLASGEASRLYQKKTGNEKQ